MFIIVWEYIVSEGKETEFEKIYGSNGEWVRLFKLARGYLGTELFRDLNHSRHYITIDRWDSLSAFASFKEEYQNEYEAIDARCEFLTEHEINIGGSDMLLST